MPSRRTGRLTPIDRTAELLPWKRASDFTVAELYWIPIESIPPSTGQRRWLLLFLERLSARLAQQAGLRQELFLQMKSIHPLLVDTFLSKARENHPLLGLSRHPHAPLPPRATLDDVQMLADGRRTFDMNDYVGDYCYWFLNKAPRPQMETFFGYGGLTSLYLKAPAPAAQKPPIPPKFREHPTFKPLFEELNVDALGARASALSDGFLKKSKQLFGDGLENDPQWWGLVFILPLLATRDFLTLPGSEVAGWFELFDVYWNESPSDGGLVLASKQPIEETMIELIEQLREERREYPPF